MLHSHIAVAVLVQICVSQWVHSKASLPEVIFEGDVQSHSGIAHANRGLLNVLLAVSGNGTDGPHYGGLDLVRPPSSCSHASIVAASQNDTLRAIHVVPWPPGRNWTRTCTAHGIDPNREGVLELFSAGPHGWHYTDATLATPRVTIRSTTWLPTALPGIVSQKTWRARGRPLPTDRSRLILHMPWEVDGFPMRWSTMINRCVDEIWVPSLYVKTVLQRAEVLSSKDIFVVPHALVGRTPANSSFAFKTDSEASPPVTPEESVSSDATKPFVFLFVGGVLPRKGIDILLDAFTLLAESYDAVRPVELQIYASYWPTSGRGVKFATTIADKLRNFSNNELYKARKYRITIVSDVSQNSGKSQKEMDALYSSADCFVLPYRAEGFALTVYDAALQGTPALLPKETVLPTQEWLNDSSTFTVSAVRTKCEGVWPCDNSSTGVFRNSNGGSINFGHVWWSEVSPQNLARAMHSKSLSFLV